MRRCTKHEKRRRPGEGHKFCQKLVRRRIQPAARAKSGGFRGGGRTSFCCTARSSSAAGSSPRRRFLSSLRSVSRLAVPVQAGTVPVSAFPERDNVFSRVSRPSSLGMVPVRLRIHPPGEAIHCQGREFLEAADVRASASTRSQSAGD
eukprot:1190464-Prorocentrum_minimum.AAC.1